MSSPIRVAMWSGPRNISTALMRSWEARGDTFVCDEPLYAHYLRVTGLRHPGFDDVLRHHETDARTVIDWLTGPVPDGHRIFYQKHMAHHLLPDVDRQWIDEVTNCFLIREPRAMIPSLAKVIPNPALEETGLPQQVELFRRVRKRTGHVPPVVDSREVLLDPAAMLAALCASVGAAYTDAMLAWPPGRRATDGVWAPHWYASVEASTGFGPYRETTDPVPPHLETLHDRCRELYDELHAHRLR